jgi:hypothetical protein
MLVPSWRFLTAVDNVLSPVTESEYRETQGCILWPTLIYIYKYSFLNSDFCKQLSKKEALGQLSSESDREEHPSSGSDTERPFHHPFQIKERPASIVMNIRVSAFAAFCLWRGSCITFVSITLPAHVDGPGFCGGGTWSIILQK